MHALYILEYKIPWLFLPVKAFTQVWDDAGITCDISHSRKKLLYHEVSIKQ